MSERPIEEIIGWVPDANGAVWFLHKPTCTTKRRYGTYCHCPHDATVDDLAAWLVAHEYAPILDLIATDGPLLTWRLWNQWDDEQESAVGASTIREAFVAAVRKVVK